MKHHCNYLFKEIFSFLKNIKNKKAKKCQAQKDLSYEAYTLSP
jgi:hypothetical protein